MLKPLICLFLCLFAGKTAGAYTNATVELAIFCDFEFGEHFEHNETKIRQYLAIRMYDTNLRFKTLPSVDINFFVTSLTAIKSKSAQSFIEEHRDKAGKVSIDGVLLSFANWVNHRQRANLPKFDVALLALSADTNDSPKSWAFVDAACSNSYGFAVVRFEKENWWSSCGSLESGLSTVLGAEKDENYSPECHNPKYIRGKECSKNHFFFSSCTNDAIYKSIQKSSCLHRIDSEVRSIFDLNELNVQPPSIRDQCVLMTNNSNTLVNTSEENLCFSTICYSGNGMNVTAEKILYPVDNSPCDNDKSCFRGRCIPNGFQIENVVSSKCLHSSNLFTADDNLHLVNCPDVPTALDRFMIFGNDNHTVFLAVPYTSSNASENSDKCMSSNGCLNGVQFKNCYKSNQTSDFNWELVDLKIGLHVFLIRHKASQFCLGSSTIDTVQIWDCNSEDTRLLWMFHDTKKPRSSVFWKDQSTPKPTENIKLAAVNGTTKPAVINENLHSERLDCHGWWVYLIICTLLFVTVILSFIILKLQKINKQIITRQLLTQDFHELSGIFAAENNSPTRHLD